MPTDPLTAEQLTLELREREETIADDLERERRHGPVIDDRELELAEFLSLEQRKAAA